MPRHALDALRPLAAPLLALVGLFAVQSGHAQPPPAPPAAQSPPPTAAEGAGEGTESAADAATDRCDYDPGNRRGAEQGPFSRTAASTARTLVGRQGQMCRLAEPFAGRPLYATTVECDTAVCTDEARRASLLQVVGLDPTDELDPRAVGDAWLRLWRTGLFRELEVRVEPALPPRAPTAGADGEGDGEAAREAEDEVDDRPPPRFDAVRVRFIGLGHVVITDLDVEYVGWQSRLYPQLFRSEIRKRLPLRRGGSFPRKLDGPAPEGQLPLEADDLEQLEEWQSRVVSLYEQMGYVGTTARIRPTWHGPGDTLVRVVVEVDEGRQPEIGEVLVRGNRAMPYWRVVEPLTTGERIDMLRDIFAIFGVGRYARRELKDELEQVEARYREEGWVTARVRLESPFAEKDDRVYPRVRIFEGPRLEVRFEGNTTLDDAELEEVLTFAENGAIDDTELESSREAIVAAYQAIARHDVRVEASLKRAPDVSRVRFTIDEGGRIYARRVEIVGNELLDDETIFEAMETRGIAPNGVINAFGTSAGVLQTARIINDLIAIRELYRDRGMPGVRFRCGDPQRVTAAERDAILSAAERPQSRDAAMGPQLGPATTRFFDVWTDDPVNHICYRVLPDPDPRLAVLRIELEEGVRATVDGLGLGPLLDGGTEQVRDEAYDLLEELGFVDDTLDWQRTGLNRRKLDAVSGFVARQMRQQGFIDVEVAPRCPAPPLLPSEEQTIAQAIAEDREPETLDPCADANLYGRRLADLGFAIELGPKTYVDGIVLQGNLITAESVIDAELLFEDGEPLGTDQLFRSQANLRSLGIFDAVQMETISDDRQRSDQRDAAVMITVEEGDYRYADAYLGLQIDSTPIEDELPVLYSLGGSIRDRNLLGLALEVGAGFNYVNRIEAPFTFGRYDETVFEAGPFLKDRRLFGTRVDLTVETTYYTGRTSQRDAYEQAVEFKPTFGYDFYNLSYPDDWGRGLRATLVTDYRIEQRRGLVRNGEVPLFGDPTQSVSLEPTLTWDRRDSPLHPSRGWLLLASAEIVFNAFNQFEQFVLEPSFKETITAQYVQSFFEGQLIVVPTLRLGAVQTGQAEADLKSGFFFKAGGDGVALPVRGYGDAVIEACQGRERSDVDLCDGILTSAVDLDEDGAVIAPRVGGKAMLLGSVEARFPTFLIDDFWWALFGDVGAVAPDWSRMSIDRVYPAAGVGLRWLVTGQVPLRLDLAYPLRKDAFEEQTLRLHLNIFYPL